MHRIFCFLLPVCALFVPWQAVSQLQLQSLDSLIYDRYFEQASDTIAYYLSTDLSQADKERLQARQYFSEGIQTTFKMDFAGAVPHFEKALKYQEVLAVDTVFLANLRMVRLNTLVEARQPQAAFDAMESLQLLYPDKPQSKTEADLHLVFARTYGARNDFYNTISHYEKAISYYEENGVEQYDLHANMYNNLARFYQKIGDFRKSLHYQEKSIQTLLLDENPFIRGFVHVYPNLIISYSEYGDASKASEALHAFDSLINQWRVAYEQAPESWNVYDYTPEVHKLYLHHAQVHSASHLRQDELLYRSFDSFEAVYSRLSIEDKERYRNHYIACINRRVNAPYTVKTAAEHLRLINRLVAEAKEVNFPFHIVQGLLYASEFYADAGNYDMAMEILEETLSFSKSQSVTETLLQKIHLTKSKLNIGLGQNNLARENIVDAYRFLLSEQANDLNDLTMYDFENRSGRAYVSSLLTTGQLYEELYESSGNKKDLETSLHVYELAAGLFSQFYMQGEYNSELNKLNRRINEGVFRVHLALGRSIDRKWINRLENNTSQYLRAEFVQKQLQNLAIPDSMLTRRTLLLARKEYYTHGIGAQDSLLAVERIETIESELKSLDKQIRTLDAQYFTFFNKEFDIQGVQDGLQENQLIIRYVNGDENLYALAISRESIELFDLGEIGGTLEEIDILYQAIQNRLQAYEGAATNLYTRLLEPMEQLLVRKKTLTVIPEGKLNYLPFETLLKSGNPLLNRLTVNYVYSLQLWDVMNTPREASSDRDFFVAFAPEYAPDYSTGISDDAIVFRDGNRLLNLVGAGREAEDITRLLRGRLYKNKEATKASFIENAGRYQIYHLAMHAFLDEEDYQRSHLVFQEETPLYYNDLYGLNLPADLVVLSACNTGVGKLKEGEGLLGLSRALAYSGVRASVYSLWQVPDEETSEIMVSFYKYLKEGKPKNEALATAKRDFITNNPMKSHPFFWAGFVINGDVSPIGQQKNNIYWWVFGGLILMCTVIAARRRKKTSQKD